MEIKLSSRVILSTKEEGKVVNILNIQGVKNYKILISKGGINHKRGEVVTKTDNECKRIQHG